MSSAVYLIFFSIDCHVLLLHLYAKLFVSYISINKNVQRNVTFIHELSDLMLLFINRSYIIISKTGEDCSFSQLYKYITMLSFYQKGSRPRLYKT